MCIYVNDWEEQIEYWIYEITDLQELLGWEIPIRGFKVIEKQYKIVSEGIHKGGDIPLHVNSP